MRKFFLLKIKVHLLEFVYLQIIVFGKVKNSFRNSKRISTEIFKINKNYCLNELKSNAYVNIHASEINMRVYILIHIFIRFLIKINKKKIKQS